MHLVWLLERRILELVALLLSSCMSVCIRGLVLVYLASSLLESLKQIIRIELFALRRHYHSLLHRLLLVEVLDLVESDALHAARRCAC